MPTVIIYWSPGRSAEQKAAVIREVTDTLVEHADAKRSDVLIIFQNIEAGDAGRGGEVTVPPTLKANGNPPT
jgi:4-oxalocrotonate tautomerase family enzyme